MTVLTPLAVSMGLKVNPNNLTDKQLQLTWHRVINSMRGKMDAIGLLFQRDIYNLDVYNENMTKIRQDAAKAFYDAIGEPINQVAQ